MGCGGQHNRRAVKQTVRSVVFADKKLSRLVESTEKRLDRRWFIAKLSGVTPS